MRRFPRWTDPSTNTKSPFQIFLESIPLGMRRPLLLTAVILLISRCSSTEKSTAALRHDSSHQRRTQVQVGGNELTVGKVNHRNSGLDGLKSSLFRPRTTPSASDHDDPTNQRSEQLPEDSREHYSPTYPASSPTRIPESYLKTPVSSYYPSDVPTLITFHSMSATMSPSDEPSDVPSTIPTISPTESPTLNPTVKPTPLPTPRPTPLATTNAPFDWLETLFSEAEAQLSEEEPTPAPPRNNAPTPRPIVDNPFEIMATFRPLPNIYQTRDMPTPLPRTLSPTRPVRDPPTFAPTRGSTEEFLPSTGEPTVSPTVQATSESTEPTLESQEEGTNAPVVLRLTETPSDIPTTVPSVRTNQSTLAPSENVFYHSAVPVPDTFTEVTAPIAFRVWLSAAEEDLDTVTKIWEDSLFDFLRGSYSNDPRVRVLGVDLTADPVMNNSSRLRRLQSDQPVQVDVSGDARFEIDESNLDPVEFDADVGTLLETAVGVAYLQQALTEANEDSVAVSSVEPMPLDGDPVEQEQKGLERPSIVEIILGFSLLAFALATLVFWARLFWMKRQKKLRRQRLERMRKAQSLSHPSSSTKRVQGPTQTLSSEVSVSSTLQGMMSIEQNDADLPQTSEDDTSGGSDPFGKELQRAVSLDRAAWEEHMRSQETGVREVPMVRAKKPLISPSSIFGGRAPRSARQSPRQTVVYGEGDSIEVVSGDGDSPRPIGVSFPYGDEQERGTLSSPYQRSTRNSPSFSSLHSPRRQTKSPSVSPRNSPPRSPENVQQSPRGTLTSPTGSTGVPLNATDSVRWTNRGVALPTPKERIHSAIQNASSDSTFEPYGDPKPRKTLRESWDLDENPVVDKQAETSQFSFVYPLRRQDNEMPPVRSSSSDDSPTSAAVHESLEVTSVATSDFTDQERAGLLPSPTSPKQSSVVGSSASMLMEVQQIAQYVKRYEKKRASALEAQRKRLETGRSSNSPPTDRTSPRVIPKRGSPPTAPSPISTKTDSQGFLAWEQPQSPDERLGISRFSVGQTPPPLAYAQQNNRISSSSSSEEELRYTTGAVSPTRASDAAQQRVSRSDPYVHGDGATDIRSKPHLHMVQSTAQRSAPVRRMQLPQPKRTSPRSSRTQAQVPTPAISTTRSQQDIELHPAKSARVSGTLSNLRSQNDSILDEPEEYAPKPVVSQPAVRNSRKTITVRTDGQVTTGVRSMNAAFRNIRSMFESTTPTPIVPPNESWQYTGSRNKPGWKSESISNPVSPR